MITIYQRTESGRITTHEVMDLEQAKHLRATEGFEEVQKKKAERELQKMIDDAEVVEAEWLHRIETNNKRIQEERNKANAKAAAELAALGLSAESVETLFGIKV